MSRVYGRHIETNCQIFDLTNGSIRKMMSRQCLNLLKMGAKVAQDYYPETMGNCLVVNAPKLFSALWAIVKGFLDERTRSKVRIVGAAFVPVLHEHIDPENLPTFLGGFCTCYNDGGCLNSGAGPWNDYVVVNKRLKHKSEIEEEKSDEEEKRDQVDFEVNGPISAQAAANSHRKIRSDDSMASYNVTEPFEDVIMYTPGGKALPVIGFIPAS